ncbi:MAG: hypothetical protein WAZ18_00195 [Alphaproteobacteria bacterium]
MCDMTYKARYDTVLVPPVFHLFTPYEMWRYLALRKVWPKDADRMVEVLVQVADKPEGKIPFRLAMELEQGVYPHLVEKLKGDPAEGANLDASLKRLLGNWNETTWLTYVRDKSPLTHGLLKDYLPKAGVGPLNHDAAEHLEFQLLAVAHHYGLLEDHRPAGVMAELVCAAEEGLLLNAIPGRLETYNETR